jgi:aspartyl-tRNA(Asn)/glutamyl-tRNA(Gln) amidotransferase subunit A
MPFNVTGTPAIAVPTGFSAGGLPLGMQIATRAFDETMLYRIAHAFCAATRLTERRPPALAPLSEVRLTGCRNVSRTAEAGH